MSLSAAELRSTSRRRAGVLAPAAAGVGVFLTVVALRLAGLLDGPVMIGVLGLLLLGFPTSDSLSRRIVLILPPMLGFTPLLWWIPELFTVVDYGAFVLAAVAGAFAAWAAWAASRPGELGRVLPRFRPLDVLPVLTGAAAVVTQLPVLAAGSADRALSLLSLNWDNASHFTMYSTLQARDRVIPLLGLAGDGTRWSFQDYPQGFHAVLATASQLAFGPVALGPEAAVVAYARLSALVTVMAAVLVSAGLVSLPVMRRRPLVATPVVAAVSAGWVFGPGAMAYQHGFPNFYLGVALVVSAVLVVSTMAKPLLPLPLAALGGCAVGVAQNWVLLLVFLVPLPLVLFLPARAVRWRAPWTGWVTASVTVLLTVAGVSLALGQISAIEVKTVIEATGGVPDPNVVEVTAILVACAVLSFRAARSRGAAAGSLVRRRLPLLVLAAGALFILWFGGVQLVEAGKLSYYVLKFLIAFELVALVLAAVALMIVLERPRLPVRPRAAPPGSRLPGVAVAVLAAGAATQLFGSAPVPWGQPLLGASAAAREAVDQQEAIAEVPAHIHALLRAVEEGGGEPAIYITTEDWTVFNPLLAQQWYSALTGTYTEGGWELSLSMFPLVGNPSAVDGVVDAIREQAPGTRFIINP
ncbi:hypothetical protein [Arthrobacter agilis]|uniref:hypothetical protein n=1 Tax=Arthrobacter agilis TaxID=37921 RepID=UPI00278A7833|nr:hypothetical protein [Arthrobacter agilis]MDQ0735514.1 hypothetical protein [Arthrobacter agilis]